TVSRYSRHRVDSRPQGNGTWPAKKARVLGRNGSCRRQGRRAGLMIGLDTNILVRFIAQDHHAQTAAATRLIDSLSSDVPGYLSLVVLAELIWVLQFSYRFDKPEIEKVIERLVRSKELVLEKKETVSQALKIGR